MKRLYALNPITTGLYKDSRFEPQRTNNFEVHIDLPPALAGIPGASIEERQKYLTFAITSANLPNIQITPVPIAFGNAQISFAGQAQYGSGSFSINDYVGSDTEGILYSWISLVNNPETGQIGWSQNYKTNGRILLYSADGFCMSSWVLLGLWITGLDGGQVSRDGSNVRTISATFNYDLALRRFNSSSRGDGTTNGTDAIAADIAKRTMLWNGVNWKDHGINENTGGPLSSDDASLYPWDTAPVGQGRTGNSR